MKIIFAVPAVTDNRIIGAWYTVSHTWSDLGWKNVKRVKASDEPCEMSNCVSWEREDGELISCHQAHISSNFKLEYYGYSVLPLRECPECGADRYIGGYDYICGECRSATQRSHRNDQTQERG